MDLIKNEFFCPECGKYFTFYLSLELNQNYRIHCPNCKHHHYRKVERGTITEIRILDNLKEFFIADICPMKSSCRDYSEEEDRNSYFYHQAAKGFLYRLWMEYKGHLLY